MATKRKDRLTPEQRVAIGLEAAGHPTDVIAKTLDVNKKTVEGWHNQDLYVSEVDRIGRDLDVEFQPLVRSARLEVMEAAKKAMSTLTDALDAVTKDGRPATALRVQAASLIYGYAMKLIVASEGGGAGGDGDDNSTNMQFNTNFNIKLNEDGSADVRQLDAIEGVATEIED